MKRNFVVFALCALMALIVASIAKTGAAPSVGAASWFRYNIARSHFSAARGPLRQRAGRGGGEPGRVPDEVRFREVAERGLLVDAWVNGAGRYTFAIDTGAGATLISPRVAQAAGITTSDRPVQIGGLSGSGFVSGREATVRSLAVGDSGNFLPARGQVIVTDAMPSDIDGVLDPTEAYWPLGYSIDLPHGVLSAFDPRLHPLRINEAPPGGAVVPWVSDNDGRRPFVMLDNGHRALVDTGSEFGLAVSESAANSFGIASASATRRNSSASDLSRGTIQSRRVAPATVRVGPLTLRGVPTDLLSGVAAGSPVLLGRDALRPFQITFDPLNRLIRFVPQPR